MTFVAPAALWGLLAIPVLIALYLLRVRRREHAVSSILLWQRSLPTLAAYHPTRRIERSVLLLLQILAVAALVTGLAQPVVIGRGSGRGDLVLVLDASLSMRARDVAPTRFDRARAEALEEVSRLRPGQRAGVVLAAPHPLLLAPPSGDRARVRAALIAAEPLDAAGDVAAAVWLAAAQAPAGDAQIVVWTDAARGPLPALPHVAYRIVGTSGDNVGITGLRVLRDPQGMEALVRVENFGPSARRVPLEVSRDQTLVYSETLTVEGETSRAVVVPLRGGGGGILHARLAVRDELPEDDVADAVIDPAPLPAVLLVTPGNPYIETVLRLLPVARAAEAHHVDPATWASFDVVILDRVDPGSLPRGNYLLIGTVPRNLPVSVSGTLSHPGIAAWDQTDPVLRFVDLGEVRIDRSMALAPEGGRVLVRGQTPLIWAYEGRGIRSLLFGFSLTDTDLPLHVAFPILMANSLAWLGGGVSDARAGEPIQIPAGGQTAAVLVMPSGRSTRLRAVDGMFLLPPPARAGVYRLTTAAGIRQFAVTIGTPAAGRIRPGQAPAVPAASPGDQGQAAVIVHGALLTRVPLWPLFLVGAVAVALGEWVLATRRQGGEP
jgi:Ca-activated chloride channel homolog